MTNTPPNGAFRGFGAPQTQFAAEVQMDRVAAELGLNPVRVREINALRPGDTTATGQRLGKDCSALQVLREAVKRTDFKKRRRAIASSNGLASASASRLRRAKKTKHDPNTQRGLGLSLFFHGSRLTCGRALQLA